MSCIDERYLGGSDRDFERSKSHSAKWSNGIRLKNSNKTLNRYETELHADAKVRPQKRISEVYKGQPRLGVKTSKGRSIILPLSPAGACSHRLVPKTLRVDEEIKMPPTSSSVGELCPYSVTGPSDRATYSPTASGANIFYSFDAAQAPGRPLPLEVYIRPDGRATDKFVEREYEVVDRNGDSVRGKKALRSLRNHKEDQQKRDEEMIYEEDGFELV